MQEIGIYFEKYNIIQHQKQEKFLKKRLTKVNKCGMIIIQSKMFLQYTFDQIIGKHSLHANLTIQKPFEVFTENVRAWIRI